MIALTSVNDSITLQTINAISTDFVVNYGDQNNTTPSFTPGSNQGNVSTATTTTIIAAPTSGVQRLVKNIIITNRGVSAQQVQFWKVVSGNSYALSEIITIAAGYNLRINQNGDFILNMGSSSSVASTSLPLMDGIAAVGSEGTTADGLHIHPADTTRAPKHRFDPGNSSVLTWSNTTRLISISGTFDVYLTGVKYPKIASTETGTTRNTTGQFFVYYNSSGVLTVSTSLWNFQTDAPVSSGYWNADLGDGFALDERHQNVMDWATHYDIHQTMGAQCISGFAASGYQVQPATASNAGNQIAIASGVLRDEDYLTSISAVFAGGPYTVFYRYGVSDYRWVKSLTLPFRVGSLYVLANTKVGGVWQDTELATKQYMCLYCFAQPALDQVNWNMIWIPGQTIYNSLAAAQAETIDNLDLTGMPSLEYGSLYQIILGTGNSAGYTGATGRCRFEQTPKRVFSNRLQTSSSNSASGMSNPMTTLGDIIIGQISGAADRLAGNTSTTPALLVSTGSGSAANIPAWTLTTAVNVGSANALVSPVTTGLVEVTGMGAGQTRIKTVTDANDTLLELNGGPYTVNGLWTFTQKVTAQSFHGFPITRKLLSDQVLDDYASVVIQGPLLMNGHSITMGVGSMLRIMI
jgi:hypothetical protein